MGQGLLEKDAKRLIVWDASAPETEAARAVLDPLDAVTFDRTPAINAGASMHLTRAILPGMTARGRGHVINIASAAALVSNPNMSVRAAGKWAATRWSESLRQEMERSGTGVRVTTVLP